MWWKLFDVLFQKQRMVLVFFNTKREWRVERWFKENLKFGKDFGESDLQKVWRMIGCLF